jgi:hypothetical protein
MAPGPRKWQCSPFAPYLEESLRKLSLALALGASALLSGCATHYLVDPIAGPNQEVRYDRGEPTTYSELANGAVQITPFGVDERDGRLVFGVAAYNKSQAPANFGVENVYLSAGDGRQLRVFTADQLVHEAQARANGASVAVAILGLAAAVAAIDGASWTESGRYWTRRGPVRFVNRYNNPGAAMFGAVTAGVGTGLAIGSIRNDLNRRIAGIDNEILTTTTIDPDESTGGIVVGEKITAGGAPRDVMVTVNFNGEQHQFQFGIVQTR